MSTSWTLKSLETPKLINHRNGTISARKPSIFSPQQSPVSAVSSKVKQLENELASGSEEFVSTPKWPDQSLASDENRNIEKHPRTQSVSVFDKRNSSFLLDQGEVSFDRKKGSDISKSVTNRSTASYVGRSCQNTDLNYAESDDQVLSTSNRERDSISREPANERILSVFYGSGSLGAALFDVESSCLCLLRDIPEISPEFELLSSLIHQVEPHHVLVSARQGSELLDKLSLITGNTANASQDKSADIDDDAQDAANRNINLIIRPSLEYNPTSCRRRVFNTELPESSGLTEQELQLRSAIYFDVGSDNMIRAAGALLTYHKLKTWYWKNC